MSEPISAYAPIEMHAPELYAVRQVAQGVAGGLDALTDSHIAQYHAQGYLVVHDAFTPGEVRDAIAGLVHLIGGGNPAFRGIQFEATALDNLDTLTAEQRQDAVRKLMWFSEFDARLDAMAHHPKLMAVVERLLRAAPILFQDQALLKPPRLGREKPWHQDKAYFNLDKREPVVGVWVALDEATLDNGCMHLLPELGREPIIHFQRRDWQVCDTLVMGKRCIAAPLKPGGLLLFDGLLVHGTPHNNSNQRRRAVQFHYHREQFPKVSNDERMAVFGEGGKDVTC
jgi:phytanoyl-CoA hydroxylase